MFNFNKTILLLCFLLLTSCAGVQDISSEQPTTTSSTSTSTSTTVKENPLAVNNYEDLPDALVRIEVKSTKAELTDDLGIDIFEYEGTGSGFFISSDGYIVTNNHVVSGAVTIDVFTQYRSQPYTAKLIGLSECDDLAILKINIDDAKYLVFSNSEPKLGQDILAAGFPLGDEEVTFLNGIVSKKQANGSTSWAAIEYAFEHTAEILPGSSGGPIVNDEVEVLGIAYAGNEDRQEFGIPIVLIKDKIQQIIENQFNYSFKANVEQFYGGGLYIYSVESNSPFREVGLRGGELITEIKGLSITEESTLKVYCNAIFGKNPNIGINFSGISLENLESFEVEVSLDGSVANINNRVSLTTTSTKATTTTTTLPPKPYFDQNILNIYKESFGHGGYASRWRQDNVTISILGNPSSLQERLVRDTANLFNSLIDGVNISIVDNNNGDMKFYFGPISNWGNVLPDCKVVNKYQDIVTTSVTGIGIASGNGKVSACFLNQDLYDNFSNYQICKDGIPGCAIHEIRRAFWLSFVGWNVGRADMNTHGWGYCTQEQTHISFNSRGPDSVSYYGEGGPISPCSWCCNCNTPQFSEIDKQIIQIHNHEYVKASLKPNITTVDDVYNLLKP